MNAHPAGGASHASPYLIKAMIAKNEHRLAGRSPPPHGESLYAVYRETLHFREILRRKEADAIAAAAARRKRLPYPSDLRAGGHG